MTDIFKLASFFRAGIEKASKEHDDPFFVSFPRGQCMRTSDMLSQFLIDNGISPIYMVCGAYYTRRNCYTHAWLYVHDNIVDITADQFRNRRDAIFSNVPVYVTPTSKFHSQFEVDERYPSDHFGINKNFNNYYNLKILYWIIQKYIPYD